MARRETKRLAHTMRQFGRLLQMIALVVTPVSMFMPPAPPGQFRFPGPIFSMLIVCACVFWIGRLIEGYAAR